MPLLRYIFNPPMTVGRMKHTPSGRVYTIRDGDSRIIDVDEADVEFMLDFRGNCCRGGKKPMFERVEEEAPDG